MGGVAMRPDRGEVELGGGGSPEQKSQELKSWGGWFRGRALRDGLRLGTWSKAQSSFYKLLSVLHPLSPSQTYDPREGYNPQPPDLSVVTLSRELQVRSRTLYLGSSGLSESGP